MITMDIKTILIIGFIFSYKINQSQGLSCYKCGYDDQYDVCGDAFRWKEKSCTTVSKLSSGEMLTCIKTSFKYYQNYRQGNFSMLGYVMNDSFHFNFIDNRKKYTSLSFFQLTTKREEVVPLYQLVKMGPAKTIRYFTVMSL